MPLICACAGALRRICLPPSPVSPQPCSWAKPDALSLVLGSGRHAGMCTGGRHMSGTIVIASDICGVIDQQGGGHAGRPTRAPGTRPSWPSRWASCRRPCSGCCAWAPPWTGPSGTCPTARRAAPSAPALVVLSCGKGPVSGWRAAARQRGARLLRLRWSLMQMSKQACIEVCAGRSNACTCRTGLC